jgi:hypothetical protein
MTMRIKGWTQFQHFKDRKPPWIKLYRDLLDDVEWHELDPKAAKALVMLWLIASENDGDLPDYKNLAFRLRTSVTEVKSLISKLSHWVIQDDINLISTRYQVDSLETETETETERELETDTDRHASVPAVIQSRFDEIKLAYPKRGGSLKWPDAERAYNARLAEGHTHEEILAGCERYNRFVTATGKVNTEFVQQAATFLGRNKGFTELWQPPAIVKDVRQMSAVERVQLATERLRSERNERVVSEQTGSGFESLEQLMRDVR